MESLETLNSYLKALSLVNSIQTGDLWWEFHIQEAIKMNSHLDTLIQFEKSSEFYMGYSKFEYQLTKLQKGFDELEIHLSKIFMRYLEVALDSTFSMFESNFFNENREIIEKTSLRLSNERRKNILAAEFVRKLQSCVGDCEIYLVKVTNDPGSRVWSVLDPYFGAVYLLCTENSANILYLGGTD